jgi:hypothetical protein
MFNLRTGYTPLILLTFAACTTHLCGAWLQPARADEAYYLIVFASQHPDNQPKYSHTFAAFLRVTDGAKTERNVAKDAAALDAAPLNATQRALETAVISWLPATGSIELARVRPEPGKNFGLVETLDWAAKYEARVSAWGPFRIEKALYESARRQVEHLESGAVLYKAVDLARVVGLVTNCIHAVCDLDIVKEYLVTGKARGDEASEKVARFFRPWILRAEPLPGWANERLGLAKYKIAIRALD